MSDKDTRRKKIKDWKNTYRDRSRDAADLDDNADSALSIDPDIAEELREQAKEQEHRADKAQEHIERLRRNLGGNKEQY